MPRAIELSTCKRFVQFRYQRSFSGEQRSATQLSTGLNTEATAVEGEHMSEMGSDVESRTDSRPIPAIVGTSSSAPHMQVDRTALGDSSLIRRPGTTKWILPFNA